MPQSERTQISEFQTYRPPCSKCGAPTMLARIEPTEPGHDIRTFECSKCGHTEFVNVAYR